MYHSKQGGGGGNSYSGGGGNPGGNTNPSNAHWEGVFINCNQCLQPITDARNVLTPCLHCFCYQCAQQQFSLFSGCPVCRTPFNPSKDVRCISTTDNDIKEYGRRLCTFSPKQLVDIFSYALKYWSWQQQLHNKFKAKQDQIYNKNDQEFASNPSLEVQQENNELYKENQGLQRYVKQLEMQIQRTGGSLPMIQQPPAQSRQQPLIQHQPLEQQQLQQQQQQLQHRQQPQQPQQPQQQRQHQQQHQQPPPQPQPIQPQPHQMVTRTPAAYPHTPFTPFTHSTRANNPTKSAQQLPMATPATFGMIPYQNYKTPKQEQEVVQHTSYRNSTIPQQNITPINVLGDRARVAATRRYPNAG